MFKYRVENKSVVKNVKKVMVLSEGAVGYKALGIKQGNTLILDLGSRTLNIAILEFLAPAYNIVKEIWK